MKIRGRKVQQFRYRAETQINIWAFQRRVIDFAVSAEPVHFCRVIAADWVEDGADVVTLKTTVPLDTLIRLALECEDCHRIAQTIQPAEKFTGEIDSSRTEDVTAEDPKEILGVPPLIQ